MRPPTRCDKEWVAAIEPQIGLTGRRSTAPWVNCGTRWGAAGGDTCLLLRPTSQRIFRLLTPVAEVRCLTKVVLVRSLAAEWVVVAEASMPRIRRLPSCTVALT